MTRSPTRLKLLRSKIRNQQGWGLTAKKEWTDKDFIIHDPISGEASTVCPQDTDQTEIYWFFPDLNIDGEPHTFDKFIVREVELTDRAPKLRG